jgi:plastocyanin
MLNFAQIAVGFVILLVVAGGLLYIFYSRTNAVEKTGYSSLIMLAVISLMIPIFWISEGNSEAAQKSDQHVLAVQRGMMLYAQYCVDKCYTIDKNGKIQDPKWNGFTIDQMNQMTDVQLRRVISAGVYAPGAVVPANASLITQSQDYGGPLSSNDIDYLFEFLRSPDKAYSQQNGYTGASAANGFDQLANYLQTNDAASYATAQALGTLGQFGAPTDMTKQKAITIDIVSTAPGQNCNPACFQYQNIKVKVGTKITWVNKDSVGHTVTAIVGESTASPKAAPQIFDSANGSSAILIGTNGTYTYTVTQAAYNFNPDHAVVYYCRVHPTMLAEITVVQ